MKLNQLTGLNALHEDAHQCFYKGELLPDLTPVYCIQYAHFDALSAATKHLIRSNLMNFIDLFKDKGSYYLVLHACTGKSLERFMRKTALEYSHRVQLALLYLEGILSYEHFPGGIRIQLVDHEQLLISEEGMCFRELVDYTRIEITSDKQVYRQIGNTLLKLLPDAEAHHRAFIDSLITGTYAFSTFVTLKDGFKDLFVYDIAPADTEEILIVLNDCRAKTRLELRHINANPYEATGPSELSPHPPEADAPEDIVMESGLSKNILLERTEPEDTDAEDISLQYGNPEVTVPEDADAEDISLEYGNSEVTVPEDTDAEDTDADKEIPTRQHAPETEHQHDSEQVHDRPSAAFSHSPAEDLSLYAELHGLLVRPTAALDSEALRSSSNSGDSGDSSDSQGISARSQETEVPPPVFEQVQQATPLNPNVQDAPALHPELEGDDIFEAHMAELFDAPSAPRSNRPFKIAIGVVIGIVCSVAIWFFVQNIMIGSTPVEAQFEIDRLSNGRIAFMNTSLGEANITAYSWDIYYNDILVQSFTDENLFPIFQTEGTYRVLLKVKDKQGQWSTPFEKTYIYDADDTTP